MLISLAILPAIVLFIVIWRSDKTEKEPLGLLLRLFLFGAASVAFAILVGTWSTDIVASFLDKESMLFIAIDNFILTALVEEGGKYFVLKKGSWKHPAFNYTFDGVVYAVVVSLGFATLENILYVLDGGLSTAITRAIISVPGHAMDGVFMGFYYGLAKKADVRGEQGLRRSNLIKALLVPTLLHGFYDFCLSTPYDIFLLIFLVFEVIFTIVTIRKVRKLSKEDEAIVRS